ncbi:MAG: hypothetical protein K6G16_08780 [Lachnospiraceae bacterium]|nr:hypothetical protein [Lachnospiraceae bacterium]
MSKRLLCPILLSCIIVMLLSGCGSAVPRGTLHVALPYSDNVQDADTNYYIGWLEDRTGLDLEITTVRQTRSTDYLDMLFSSDTDIDVILFGGDFTVSPETVEAYVRAGDIDDTDGVSWYANAGADAREGAGQILWINYEWLTGLGLAIPTTTEELEAVLCAFRDRDPNGNGLKDEIPLAGSMDAYVYSPVEFILNAFVYNDPIHSRYGLGDDADVLMASSDGFREGLAFCRRFYAEGLLDAHFADCSRSLLSELVNSPSDLVGAFTTGSISDVVYQGNPEIMARYVHVLPPEGPGGVRNALYSVQEPTVGAVITKRSTKKAEARKLLETMLSEEASLIARFGERGVDWDFSDGLDVSIYGGTSTVVTRNYIWNTSQNKHLNGIGPMNVPERYIGGVTWNGVNSDAEYIDGRAQMSYREFLPAADRFHERDEALSSYMDRAVADFVLGKRDIGSDREWEDYLKELSSY